MANKWPLFKNIHWLPSLQRTVYLQLEEQILEVIEKTSCNVYLTNLKIRLEKNYYRKPVILLVRQKLISKTCNSKKKTRNIILKSVKCKIIRFGTNKLFSVVRPSLCSYKRKFKLLSRIA